MSKNSKSTSQPDKFKDLAREVDADEDEAAFAERLRRMRHKERQDEEKDRGGDA